jgi:hypothetical protein
MRSHCSKFHASGLRSCLTCSIATHRPRVSFAPHSGTCAMLWEDLFFSASSTHSYHSTFVFLYNIGFHYLLYNPPSMPYEVEDEIDWSDSPLGPPSPVRPEPPSSSSRVDSVHHDDPSTDSLFMSETTSPYTLPTGTPLPFSSQISLMLHEKLTNAQQPLTSARASKPFLPVHSGPELVSI